MLLEPQDSRGSGSVAGGEGGSATATQEGGSAIGGELDLDMYIYIYIYLRVFFENINFIP